MFEAYKVAVKLSLINNVSGGLLSMAGQFQSLNKHISSTRSSVSALERDMLSLKRLGMVGGAMAAAGGFGLSLFSAPIEEAKKFQIEAAKFASLGFGDVVNRDAVEFAKGMKTIGTSARDNMGIIGDAMAVFKDLNESKMVAPLMAKMKFANHVIFGADGGERDTKLMDMMKVVEFRGGLKSPEEFTRQANFAQQAIAGSRNRVDPTAMLLALKSGGVALSRRSNEAFYLGAEPLLQEFGGSRYGTAAMSVYQNLVQSRGTITAQQELYRLGLLDKSKVQFNSLGKLKKALPGAFQGSSILESEGELALLEKVLLPAFAKKGITSEDEVLRELGMILGNRTGSSLMARIYQQREKLHMQTDANYHAENLDQASARAAGTMEGKEVDLHAKWRDVLNALGTTVLPIAIKAVEGLTVVVKGISDFAGEWPLLTRWLVVGFGVLSGIVAVGGTLALATAGFAALKLALAATGVAGGIGGMLGGVASGIGWIAKAASALGLLVFAAKDLAEAAATGSSSSYRAVNGVLGYLTGDENFNLGGKIYDWTHKAYDPNAKTTPSQPANMRLAQPGAPLASNWARPLTNGTQPMQTVMPRAAQQRTTINNKIVLPNGRVLAEVVTEEQSREANRPNARASGFDWGMGLAPVALGYNR